MNENSKLALVPTGKNMVMGDDKIIQFFMPLCPITDAHTMMMSLTSMVLLPEVYELLECYHLEQKLFPIPRYILIYVSKLIEPDILITDPDKLLSKLCPVTINMDKRKLEAIDEETFNSDKNTYNKYMLVLDTDAERLLMSHSIMG